MSHISIKDIAQELGISTTSVSLVLNGKEKEGRVSKKLADKIRKKAKEMNYEPNTLARSLRMGKSNIIGLIVADISNPFFANMSFHIQEYAEKYGYSVIIANTNESDLKMENMVNILKNRQVDGFIIVPTESGNEQINDLLKRKIPVVLIDRYFSGINVSHVTVNNYLASKGATNYLIDQGCKNIAFMLYNNQLGHMKERKRGYLDTLKDAGLFNPQLIKEINHLAVDQDVESAVTDLFSLGNKIDGIFFAAGAISLSGIKCLINKQIKIPDEIRVVCFDKSEVFDFMQIPIPYIQQPVMEMGETAVEILIKQIKKEIADPLLVEIPAELHSEF